MQTEQVDLNVNMYNNKKEEFKVHLIESIEDVLSFSKVVLDFLELYSDFNQERILDEPWIFSSELEDLFGDSAKGIQDLVLKRLYLKINQRYKRDRMRSFEDYLSDALKRFTESH
ncbi:MAG: hypothetical protein V3R57_08130 [Candidatus Bathyarchaeia archaeon]